MSEAEPIQISVLIVEGGLTEGMFPAGAPGKMAIRDNTRIMVKIACRKYNYDNL